MNFKEAATITLCALTFGLSSCGKSLPSLNLKVGQSGGEITITNLDENVVDSCYVHINYDWKVSNITLHSGVEKAIPMSEFVNGDGERFNMFLSLIHI